MKTTYILLITLLLTGVTSCTRSGDEDDPIVVVRGEQEVELTILTFDPTTRASTPDPGVAKERQIDELDLLIFKDNKYQYSREAFKLSGYTYRANLKVDNTTLTAYAFANYRAQLAAWEEAATQEDKSWETIQAELIDLNPSRLVSNEGEILPMWGKTEGSVSETQVSGWNPVLMLRSVASVDAYIEQNDKTDKFILTDAHLYYAPDQGYIAPEPDGDGYKLSSPPEMKTILNTLHASGTAMVSMDDGAGGTIEKTAIANQLYLYDNDITPLNFSPPARRYTRLILAGYYNQPNPDPDPITSEDRRIKTYYPLDFVAEDGNFHDIKRNYKYVFNITSVHGEGYGSIEEAADEYPINMDVNIIEWNREDEYIGVQGKYYLSMKRKHARLSFKAGSTDQLKLTYEILDDTPGATFRLAFTTTDNGEQTPPTSTSPWPQVIQNDYFKVSLLHDTENQTADFIVEALQDYTTGHDTDEVEIRFRDLKFHISITQSSDRYGDWEDGGNQDEELDNN